MNKRKSLQIQTKGQERELVDVSFDIIVLVKILIALFEVIAGFVMLFITPARMQGMIHWLTKGFIREEHINPLVQMLIHFGEHFTTSTALLIAIYFLGHGLVKLVTLGLLWKKILWAYPLSIVVLIAFIAYQAYEIAVRHSIVMILITLVDIVMIVLTWIEYKKMKEQRKKMEIVREEGNKVKN